MPVINHPDKITDYEIEKALSNEKKMEQLLDKIFKIFSRKPDGSLKKLQDKMKPFLTADDSPEVRKKALKTIKEFLEQT